MLLASNRTYGGLNKLRTRFITCHQFSNYSSFRDLDRATKEWLRDPHWEETDQSIARQLVNSWTKDDPSRESALLCSKILRKCSFHEKNRPIPALSPVLTLWQKIGGPESVSNSVDLVQSCNGQAKDYTIVMKTLSNQNPSPRVLATALSLFRRVAEPDLILTNAFLHVLAGQVGKDTDTDKEIVALSEDIFLKLEEADAFTWTALLRVWCAFGQVGRAMEAIHRDIPDDKLNVVHYNILLRSLSPDRGMKILRDMREGNVLPDLASYQIVTQAWRHHGGPEAIDNVRSIVRGLDQWLDLPFDKVLPIYATLMEIWAQRRESGPHVEQLFEELERRNSESRTHLDKAMYVSVVRAWSRTEGAESRIKARQAMKRLENSGQSCDSNLYTAYIDGLSEWGDPDGCDEALSILNDLLFRCKRDPDLLLTIVTFNTVLKVMVRVGDHGRAQSLLFTMAEMSFSGDTRWPPLDRVSVSTVLHAYSVRGGDPLELLAELEEVYNAGDKSSQLDTDIYHSVFEWFARNGCGDASTALLFHIHDRFRTGRSHYEPSLHECKLVISAWKTSKRIDALEQAEGVLRWMEQQSQGGHQGLTPSQNIYSMVQEVWSVSGRTHAEIAE